MQTTLIKLQSDFLSSLSYFDASQSTPDSDRATFARNDLQTRAEIFWMEANDNPAFEPCLKKARTVLFGQDH